jgi:hypothetical protein
MSTKLRNRRVAEDKLGTFLEQALVSEDLVHQVMDAPVSGPWWSIGVCFWVVGADSGARLFGGGVWVA